MYNQKCLEILVNVVVGIQNELIVEREILLLLGTSILIFVQ